MRWKITEKTLSTDPVEETRVTLYPIDDEGRVLHKYSYCCLSASIDPRIVSMELGTIVVLEFMQPAVTEPEPQHV